LTVERLIPAEAVSLADSVRLATAPTVADEVTALVWIGEHSTSLAVGVGSGADRRLLFVRTVNSGTESLAEVLCRPLRRARAAAHAQIITLPHDAARKMLLAVASPRERPDPRPSEPPGSSLLPHLQPVLQRLSIEIKQSLRFGVTEADRPKVRIRLAGPGAAIPGLARPSRAARLRVFRPTPAPGARPTLRIPAPAA